MSHDCILHSYGAVTLTESVHRQKDISTGKVLKTVSVTGSHYSECPGQHTTHTHTHTHKHTHTPKVKTHQPACHVITVSENLGLAL